MGLRRRCRRGAILARLLEVVVPFGSTYARFDVLLRVVGILRRVNLLDRRQRPTRESFAIFR
jgi:hypothetical protein